MIYAMSDIHGDIGAFNDALHNVDLSGDNKLVLLGDYIHRGGSDIKVLDKIMELEKQYGPEKVIVLIGNHEIMALDGRWPIEKNGNSDNDLDDEKYLLWMNNLREYYVEGQTIFVHAGIDEESGEDWAYATSEYDFVWKYPAQTGKFYSGDMDMKIVAGHVGTAEISGDRSFHDIYYDGESHYYIDGTVIESGIIPVLKVDAHNNKYYAVTEAGDWPVTPFDEL